MTLSKKKRTQQKRNRSDRLPLVTHLSTDWEMSTDAEFKLSLFHIEIEVAPFGESIPPEDLERLYRSLGLTIYKRG